MCLFENSSRMQINWVSILNRCIIKVSFPEGAVDLDTPEDYAKFLKTEKE